jgi:hypothetical protein
VPTETAGLFGDLTNQTLAGIATPAVILIITEDLINTTISVDHTTVFAVVAADIILTLLMEASRIIQPLMGKVSSLVRTISRPNQ